VTRIAREPRKAANTSAAGGGCQVLADGGCRGRRGCCPGWSGGDALPQAAAGVVDQGEGRGFAGPTLRLAESTCRARDFGEDVAKRKPASVGRHRGRDGLAACIVGGELLLWPAPHKVWRALSAVRQLRRVTVLRMLAGGMPAGPRRP